ncbi:MAG: hypothetical protein A2Z29_11485 [Chloroflexi bacterium RBG_16_56_11]|nr:MAG: hypothetical protein A2Z29_11485 [Chloroflexi bacterium RBG_16_56_11]
MESNSFDSMAGIFDETRVFDSACFGAALDFITGEFPPSRFTTLFEPGIGTGRIAIPLAERGYHVTGVDISDEMLKVLAEKLRKRNPPLPVTFQKADVTALPFPDAAFHIAVAVHIYHLVRDWKKALAETLRVLRPGAPLIMLWTGSGAEVPAIKTRYREICTAHGFPARHIGVTDDAERDDYLRSLGRRIEKVDNRWKWNQRISVDKAFNDIKNRYYSSTNQVPEAVHREVVEKLEGELLDQYGDLDRVVEVPTQISLVLVLPS